MSDPQVGKSVVGARTFLTVQEFLWYNCSAVCGLSAWCLCDGSSGNFLQEGLCHMLCDPGLLQPEPLSMWQPTADTCLCRRHSNTQRQVWLSLLWCPWFLVHTGFLFEPSKSLFPQSCRSSLIKSHWPSKSNSRGVLCPFEGSPGCEICCGP